MFDGELFGNKDENNWKERWDNFLIRGLFDQIKRPEDGYKIGDAVVNRAGILTLIKGFKGSDEVIIALDRKPNGKEEIVNIKDIRPNGDVMNAFYINGFVKIPPDRLMELEPPAVFDGMNSQIN